MYREAALDHQPAMSMSGPYLFLRMDECGLARLGCGPDGHAPIRVTRQVATRVVWT